MNRAPRIASCALVAALATTVGNAASAQADGADGAHRPGHSHGRHHAGLEYDGSGRVLIALSRLERRLGGALRHRLTQVPAPDRAVLRSNQAGDQTAVESVAAAYSQAPTGRHLHTALVLLHGYRPERYVRAAAILGRSARTASSIVDLSSLVVPGSSDAATLTTATDLLAAARGHRFTARTEHAEMREARREVAAARTLVDEVRADLPAGG